MSDDISIRRVGRAGRITLTRPQALNALTYAMCLAIEGALDHWAEDPEIDLVTIDAAGDKAFCAGGDLAEMYRTGSAGDYGYGQRFWRDEYRMNAKVANFPKPYVALMQGFTMGGGVGVSGHGSVRVVCETSRIAMPECGVGLVPDVGGSLLLARAPGRLGEYLGMTATRMGPGDAILAGFADHFVPGDAWPDLIGTLEQGGAPAEIEAAVSRHATAAPEAAIAADLDAINALFSGETHRDILAALNASDTPFASAARGKLDGPSPLSMAVTVELVHRVRAQDRIEAALDQEFRYTSRCMEHGDFLEGIRALIIDKDKSPKWRHAALGDVTDLEVTRLLLPLGAEALRFDTTGETVG